MSLHREGPDRPNAKLLGALMASVVALSARAQIQAPPSLETTPVQLEFTAPADCATQVQFAQRVRQRSERIELRPVAKKQLTIVIQGKANVWTGRATFTDSDQEPLSREIAARSCDEVLDGLALVTVVVLDPDAIQNSPNDRLPSPTEPPPMATPPSKPVPVVAQPSSTRPPSDNTDSHLNFGLSAIAGAKVGPAPDTMWSWGASAQVNLERPSPWSPQVRITGLLYSKDTYLARGGTASFSLAELQVSACPLVLRYKRSSLRPCAAVSYGRLGARGTRTFVPASESVVWVEGDLQVEAAWEPIPMLMVFIAPAIGIPFKRYAFDFEPYEFHRVAPLTVSGITGIGLRFL